MFGIVAQNPILGSIVIIAEFGILVTMLVYFQRLYARVSKESLEGYSQSIIMLFRAVLTIFAVTVIAANWLPWIKLTDGPHNGFELLVREGEYLLAVPLIFALLALVATWSKRANSPVLVAPLFVFYAASAVILGLLSRIYSIGAAINPVSPSILIAGIGVFPAILYAEGMPHPTNKLLHYFINLGKIRFDEAVHYAAIYLSLNYKGSATPIGFSSAEGRYKGRSISIYGREGYAIAHKIMVIKTGAKLNAIDDIIIARPHVRPEAYLEAFGMGMLPWFLEMLEDNERELLIERFEVEFDGSIISDEYNILSPTPNRALGVLKSIKDTIVDLDADLIAIMKEGIYIGYDFSLIRMPVKYMLDKTVLQLGLADKLESDLKLKPKRGRPSKEAAEAGLSGAALN